SRPTSPSSGASASSVSRSSRDRPTRSSPDSRNASARRSRRVDPPRPPRPARAPDRRRREDDRRRGVHGRSQRPRCPRGGVCAQPVPARADRLGRDRSCKGARRGPRGPDRFLEGRGERPPVPHPNHQGHVVERHGDVEAAFARAARIFEHEFTTPRIHQAPLEPRAAIVWLEGDRVQVVSTNKAPFNLREQMAATLGLAKDRIVVDNGTIGGDFGAKGLSTDEFVLYHLAKATGRPVRAITRYADELTTTNPRHGSLIRLRTGVDADGRIVAHESHALFDGGAYAAGKPTVRLLVEGGVSTLEGYRVPAARHE